MGLEEDGLVLDITGSYLFGGEAAMLDMRARLDRAGLAARLELPRRAAPPGPARHGGARERAGTGENHPDTLGRLPVAALRLEPDTVTALERLGLRTIADLAATPRAPLTRRFGPGVLLRLDQALGTRPEQIAPETEPPHYGVRLTLPEPIGLVDDVMAGTARLVERLCARLKENAAGARALCLTLRRVDQACQQVELRLASAMRDPPPASCRCSNAASARSTRASASDQLRLQATVVEPLADAQRRSPPGRRDRLKILITRIGTRIGLENIRRFLPADSHIPERGFLVAPAAWSRPEGAWVALRPRPPVLFRPEPIAGTGPRPPGQFRWRRMSFETVVATGPERIAPEWWLDDDGWRAGMRDYWHVQTRQGRRLWLFHTPQDPGWFVQGEFA